MEITIEISDAKLKEVVERSVRESLSWQGQVRDRALHLARAEVDQLPIKELVHSYIESKFAAILEDVVYKQVRHVVKLAVDAELAVARERLDPPAAEVPDGAS